MYPIMNILFSLSIIFLCLACADGTSADGEDADPTDKTDGDTPDETDDDDDLSGTDGDADGTDADADGEDACRTGSRHCPCYGNNTCNDGLVCVDVVCVSESPEDGDTVGDGDEDGDLPDGDTSDDDDDDDDDERGGNLVLYVKAEGPDEWELLNSQAPTISFSEVALTESKTMRLYLCNEGTDGRAFTVHGWQWQTGLPHYSATVRPEPNVTLVLLQPGTVDAPSCIMATIIYAPVSSTLAPELHEDALVFGHNARRVFGRETDSDRVDVRITGSSERKTWLDEDTGRIWQDPPSEPMTWADAQTYCQNLVLDGHDNWQVPDIRTLVRLHDECSRNAEGGSCSPGQCLLDESSVYCGLCVEGCRFADIPEEGCWRDPDMVGPCEELWSGNWLSDTKAWGVYPVWGNMFYDNKTDLKLVRCVVGAE